MDIEATEGQLEEIRYWLQDEVMEIFSDDDLQRLLNEEKIRDSEYRHPTDENWEPSYNVKRAAARGWLRRAAMISGGIKTVNIGDVTITIDTAYCYGQYVDLIGSQSLHIGRRDEGKSAPVEYEVPDED